MFGTWLLVSLCPLAASELDLAQRKTLGTSSISRQLHASPNVWLHETFWSKSTVNHLIAKLPANAKEWTPCVGQSADYTSKQCTLLTVTNDSLLEAAVAKIGVAWDIDVSRLIIGGLPVIRYLPGAPAVGVHGDRGADGLVPNATLLVYLTGADDPDQMRGADGQTFFPHVGLRISPQQGAVLSFQNTDSMGAPDMAAQHGVGAIPAQANTNRLVVQIPVLHLPGRRAFAYSEHVSGNKHNAHMGIMLLIFLGFGGYSLWQYLNGGSSPLLSSIVDVDRRL